MDQTLEFEGKKYISSRRAAEIAKYSNDYVGQLCREGKVNSKRVGRVWFIEEESILKHRSDSDAQLLRSGNGSNVTPHTYPPRDMENSCRNFPHPHRFDGANRLWGPSEDMHEGLSNISKDNNEKYWIDINGYVHTGEKPQNAPFKYFTDDRPLLPSINKKLYVDRVPEKKSRTNSRTSYETSIHDEPIADIVKSIARRTSSLDWNLLIRNTSLALLAIIFLGSAVFMRKEIASNSMFRSIAGKIGLIEDSMNGYGSAEDPKETFAVSGSMTSSVMDSVSNGWSSVSGYVRTKARSFLGIVDSTPNVNISPTTITSNTSNVNKSETLAISTRPISKIYYATTTTIVRERIVERPQVVTVSQIDPTLIERIADVERRMTASEIRLPLQNNATADSIGRIVADAIARINLTSSGGGGSGSVTSVNVSGGTTGLSFSGGPITTSGTFTMSGTLGIANGGTNSVGQISNTLLWYDGTSITATSSYPLSVGYLIATSSVASIIPFASSTALSISGTASTTNLVISGLGNGSNRCLQVDASGNVTGTNSACGSGGTGGTWATTTSTVVGQLLNYPLNNSDIVTIGSNATTSAEYFFDPNTQVSYLSGMVGIGTTSPYASLSVVGASGVVADHYTATGTVASVFPYASTTMISSVTASSTNLIVSNTATITYASTTMISATTASTTNLIVSGLSTSTFSGGIQASYLDLRGTNATSTAAMGINLAGGCFAVNGTCIGTGIGSGTVTSVATGNGLTGGTITNTGTISVNSAGLVTNTLTTWDGTNFVATGTPSLTIGYLISTSTTASILPYASTTMATFTTASTTNLIVSNLATIPYASTTMISATTASTTNLIVSGLSTSTFSGGIQATYLNLTGANATSTLAMGINLSGGCFAINGSCISGGSSSGASTTLLVDSNTFSGTNNFTNKTGIATSSPWGLLSINPSALGSGVPEFVIGSSTATHFVVTGGGNVGIKNANPTYDLDVTGNVNVSNSLILGGYSFASAALSGFVVGDSVGAGLPLYLYANGAERMRVANDGSIGIGTSTPNPLALLNVQGNGYISSSLFVGGNITSTSTTASVFPYASTTALTVSGIGGLTLNASLTGPLQAVNGLISASSSLSQIFGGTGITSYSAGDILYADANSNLTRLPRSSDGLVLKLNGGYPSWQTDLTSGSSGGTWATTTSTVVGELINYPLNVSDVVTIGSNATTSAEYFFDPNIGVVYLSGMVGIGTTSPYASLSVVGASGVVADHYTATGTVASVFPYASTTMVSFTTASTTNLIVSGLSTSTFSGGIQATYLNLTGASATSTASSGINLTAGCFAINGTCVGTGTGSGTVTSVATGNGLTGGTITNAGTISVNSAGLVTNTLTTWDGTNFVATGTPSLTVGYFIATTSTATSTFAGGMRVAGTAGLNVLQNGKVGLGTATPNTIFTLRTVSGSNPSFSLLDGDQAQPFTSEAVFTPAAAVEEIGRIAAASSVSGGLQIAGITKTDDTTAVPVYIQGMMGATASSVAGIIIQAYKSNGSGGLTNLANTEKVMQIANGSATLATMLGSGNLGLNTVTPYARLSIKGSGTGGFRIFDLVDSASTTIASFLEDGTGYFKGNIGIGTTSPYAALSVVGASGIVADNLNATNTNATSTLAGGLVVGSNNNLVYEQGSGITYAGALQTGNMNFNTDAGVVSWIDLPVSNAANTTVQSYTASLDDSPMITVYGISNGNGLVTNTAVGIGSSTPYAKLSIFASTSTDPMTLFAIGSTTADYATSTLFAVTNTGRVGLSTTSPTTLLSVHGGGYISSNLFVGGSITSTSTTASTFPYASSTAFTSSGSAYLATLGGKVGIASTSPWGLLSVNPNALGSGIPEFVIGSSTATHFLVTGGGRVGIKNANPAYELDVTGNVNISETLALGGVNFASAVLSGLGVGDLNGAGLPLYLYANGYEKMRITTDGNVGIGTSTPYSRLSVWGSGTGTNRLFELTNNSSTTIASFLEDGTGYFKGNIGIGTTSPYAALSVVGASGIVADNLNATNTNATSTLAGGLVVGSNNNLVYEQGSGITYAGALQTGNMNFNTDAGVVSWIDLPVSNAANTTVQSYTASLDDSPMITVYGISNGNGLVTNTAVGIGSSTPYAKLSIFASTSTDPMTLFAIGSTTADYATSTLFAVTNTGRVGIGSTSPVAALDISGGTNSEGHILLGSQNQGGIIKFRRGSDASTQAFIGMNGAVSTSFIIQNASGSSDIRVATENVIDFSTANNANTTKIRFDLLNNRAGYGTTTPFGQLSIHRNTSDTSYRPLFVVASSTSVSTTTNFIVLNSGYVGIGTSTPYTAFSVYGSSDLGNSALAGYFISTSTTSSIFPYASSTALSVSGNAYFATLGGKVGIGTTSPYAALSVVGATGIVADNLNATNTNATSTLAGGLAVGSNNNLVYEQGSGITYAGALQTGNMNFDTDAGVVSWVDLPVLSAANTSIQSYNANLNGNPMITVYGISNGNGLVTNTAVGISSSTPYAKLSIFASTSTDPMTLFAIGSTTASYATSTLFVVTNTGKVGIGTTTPGRTLSVYGSSDLGNSALAGYFTATSTTLASSFPYASTTMVSFTTASTTYLTVSGLSTSTFSGGLQATYLDLRGTQATSTAAMGINLTGGCFAVSGVCVGGGSGNGTVNSGIAGQLAWYSSSGTAVSATSTWPLTVGSLIATSTTASIFPYASTTQLTFKGPVYDSANSAGNGGQYLQSQGPGLPPTWVTSSASVSGGTAGMLTSWVTGSALTATSGPTASYFYATSTSLASTFPYASTTVISSVESAYFATNANGGKVGIATTSPDARLSVQGNALLSGNLALANLSATGTISTVSNSANSLPYASTTMVTFTTASTTNLIVSGLSTSTFSGGLQATYLDLRGVSATSTAASGINLTGGCFAMNGVCIGLQRDAQFTSNNSNNSYTLITTSATSTLGTLTITPATSGADIFATAFVTESNSRSSTDHRWEMAIRDTNCDGTIIAYNTATTTGQVSTQGASMYVSGLASNPGATGKTYVLCARAIAQSANVEWSFSLMVINQGWSDYAELYGTNDPSLQAGELITTDANLAGGVRRVNGPNDTIPIGIVSTQPGMVIGIPESGTNVVPVALSGRVPVNVSDENGPILAGDSLAVSSIPGVAMKATKAGNVVGQALEAYSGTGVGKVMAFVNNTNYNGSTSGIPDDVFETRAANIEALNLLSSLATATSSSSIVTDKVFATEGMMSPNLFTVNLSASSTLLEGLTNIAGDFSVTASTTFSGRVYIDSLAVGSLDLPGLSNIQDMFGSLHASTTLLLSTFASSTESLSNLMDLTASLSSTTAELSSTTAKIISRLDILESLFSSLNVSSSTASLGMLSLQGLSVTGSTTFVNGLTVDTISSSKDIISLMSDTEFIGRPYFTTDTGGTALVKKGAKSVEIVFNRDYIETPVVSATVAFDDATSTDTAVEAYLNSDIRFLVTKKTVHGFTVMLNKPASSDISFSWIALAVKNASLFTSKDDSVTPETPIIPPATNIEPTIPADMNNNASSSQTTTPSQTVTSTSTTGSTIQATTTSSTSNAPVTTPESNQTGASPEGTTTTTIPAYTSMTPTDLPTVPTAPIDATVIPVESGTTPINTGTNTETGSTNTAVTSSSDTTSSPSSDPTPPTPPTTSETPTSTP